MTADAVDSVSVVIPCYNGLPYLPESVQSAVAQTHRPMEIIIVDDGSTDSSARVIQELAEANEAVSIRLIQQPNSGEPAARNTGIRAARGQWVAMLDTDDWWEPTKLEKQIQAANVAGPECVMVHTGWFYHLPDGRAVPKNLDGPSRRVGWCTEALLEPTSTGHPSIMVQRDALNRIGGYDPSYRQSCDIDLYFRLSAVGTFAFVPEHLLHYRIHAKQMSASQVDQIPFHHRAVREFFEKHPKIESRIGRERIESALAEHVACKLESLWWRRKLEDFRRLLEYAREQNLDNPVIRQWRRRAKWPIWLVRLKDRLGSVGRADSAATANPEP
ncbi:MAG: glycosyltransferase family 2 protein [Phycisphaeraceae bacterium]|nr:glycosyltransferase family 2 protein [Phycisphaeraceae bacterium]